MSPFDRGFVLRFARRISAVSGLIFLLLLSVACFSAPLWAALSGQDPTWIDPDSRHLPPSTLHWLGTDDLGRDVLLRLLYGGQVSLSVAIVAGFLAIGLGALAGSFSGYVGGLVDRLFLRLLDAMKSLPRLPLMMLFLSADLGPRALHDPLWTDAAKDLIQLLFVVVAFGWMGAARLARATALELKARPFIEAARALGFPRRRILLLHLLPNAFSPLFVAASIEVGEIILYESLLSYLGLGISPPSASWGVMLRGGMSHLYDAPHLIWAPGLLTFLTVAALHFVADGLRVAQSPQSAEVR